jgi:hypothetical protein
MPNETSDHSPVIAALFAARRAEADAERAIDTLDAALGALWRRTERTLGAVLLAAVADRVIREVCGRHSFLVGTTVSESGFALNGMRTNTASVAPEQVAAGARLLLVRFLEVLGNLTGDVLTSALHRELVQLTEREGDES